MLEQCDSFNTYFWVTRMAKNHSYVYTCLFALLILSACLPTEDKANEQALKHYDQGILFTQQSQFDLAIEEYSKAIDIVPHFAKAYLNRGHAYSYKREYDKSITDYEQAIVIDPQFSLAYLNLGAVYQELGQFDQAIENYNHAIDIDPQNALTYFNRSTVYVKIGEREEAISDLERALELDLDPRLRQGAEELLEDLRQ